MTFIELHNKVLVNGGITVYSDYEGDSFIQCGHKTGFYVSQPDGYSVVLLTERDIEVFVTQYFSELFEDEEEDVMLGVWKDENSDLYHIDVTNHIGGRIEAIQLAKERKQLAIWDIANNCEIRIR